MLKIVLYGHERHETTSLKNRNIVLFYLIRKIRSFFFLSAKIYFWKKQVIFWKTNLSLFLLALFLTFNSSVELSKGGWGQLEKIDILNTGVQSIWKNPSSNYFVQYILKKHNICLPSILQNMTYIMTARCRCTHMTCKSH